MLNNIWAWSLLIRSTLTWCFFGWCTHVILSAAAAVEEVFWKFLKASLWFILHAPVAVSHSVRRLPGGQVQ